MRATWSTDPPGGNTAMIFTGFVGHVWAWAANASAAIAAMMIFFTASPEVR